LENYPNDPIPLNNLAGVYLDLGRHREAESLLQRAIAADSLAAALHGNLIDTQLELGKWTEARDSYKRMRRLLPDIAAVEMKGVDLAALTGDHLTAVARTEGVKSRFGADPTWRATSDAVLAELAATRGKFTEAESRWRDAMAGRAETAAPASYLSHAIALAGVLMVAAGQPGRGLRELEQALARYPLDSLRPLDRPYLGLAALYALGARPARVRAMVAEYERAVEPRLRRRAGPDLDRIRGLLAAAEGRGAEAISWLQRAVRRRLTPAFGLPDLGRAYDMGGGG
jgi:tetratricopeptide (TPR) repeat protein